MNYRALAALVLLAAPSTWVACSDDGDDGDGAPSTKDGGAGGGGADEDAGETGGAAASGGSPGSGGAAAGGSTGSGGAAAGGAAPLLDCTSDNWSNLSEACWKCMCDACADALGACNETCTDVMECSFEKHTLVDNVA